MAEAQGASSSRKRKRDLEEEDEKEEKEIKHGDQKKRVLWKEWEDNTLINAFPIAYFKRDEAGKIVDLNPQKWSTILKLVPNRDSFQPKHFNHIALKVTILISLIKFR